MKMKMLMKYFGMVIVFMIVGNLYQFYYVESMVQEETNNLGYFSRGNSNPVYDEYDFESLLGKAKLNRIKRKNGGYVYPFYPVEMFADDKLAESCKSQGLEYVGFIEPCEVNWLRSENGNKTRAFKAPLTSYFAKAKWRYKYREENRKYWPKEFTGMKVKELREVNNEKEHVAWMDTSFGSNSWGVELSYNILAQWLWGSGSIILKSLEEMSRVSISVKGIEDVGFALETTFDYSSGWLVYDDFITQRVRLMVDGVESGVLAYCGTTELEGELMNKMVLKANAVDELTSPGNLSSALYGYVGFDNVPEPVLNDDKARIDFIVKLYERVVSMRNNSFSLLKWKKERRLIGDFSDGLSTAYKGVAGGNGIGLCKSKT